MFDPAPVEPVKVKGIYVAGAIAGLESSMDELIELVEKTELNAMVIDIKDDKGEIVYEMKTPTVIAVGSSRNKVSDMAGLIKKLKEKGIYPIARIVVFKDPVLAEADRDLAVRTIKGSIWGDRKGQAWVDPYNPKVWDYILEIAIAAADLGFREIQFDYVRFPSDGSTKKIKYPAYDGRSRSDVIVDFLRFAKERLKPYGVFVSADLFGLTTSVTDDMGIGQEIERIAPIVDIISPMVYPSHYGPGNYGLADPDAKPYETVYKSISDAVARVGNTGVIIRPWLQDFTLRNSYGASEVKAQIQATYDNGLEEWILWNPRNNYTRSALKGSD
ncbi:hypothetical protein SY88_20105 [Clostridiales bacterium PH28_bin88]|nr:hypothetical protein SY88_20105 [Clostridiales bacterium PH28_bin88]